jgi:hypothetical protein
MEQIRRGIRFPHVVTVSGFIRMALEIEENQYVLATKLPVASANPYPSRRVLFAYINRGKTRSRSEKALIAEKRNTLRRQIEKFFAIQDAYMPGVASFRDTTNDPDGREYLKDERPELTKLWLPSALPEDVRASSCFPGVLDIYLRNRQAQVHDTLVQLRQARRMVKGVNDKYKYQVAGTGQRAITRARTTIANAGKRVDKVARRYCVARQALLALDPTGTWREKYRELDLQKDVRGPGRDQQEGPTGEGDHAPSWIWLGMLGKSFQETIPAETSDQTESQADSSAQINEILRVEWSRLSARADRWDEEHTLLVEEMQRTLAYLQWKSSDWESRASLRAADVPAAVQNGLAAYAAKQASLFNGLAAAFASQWHPVLSQHGIIRDWFDSTGTLKDLYTCFSPQTPSSHPAPPTNTAQFPEVDDEGDDEIEDDEEDEDMEWEDEENENDEDADGSDEDPDFD